jgi:6-phosphogluconolactonase (cycloisomerase 2 family)
VAHTFGEWPWGWVGGANRHGTRGSRFIMAMKRSFLQLIALLLGAISLVNCSGAPSCVLVGADTPVRVLSRTPAAAGAGCPVNSGGGGGGGNGSCSNTLTPTDVLFGQATTGAITTLAINTPVGSNLSLLCTTANAGLGQIAVANVLATSKNFLYTLSITISGTTKTGTINGFAIGHVAPVTLSAVGPAFTISGTNILQTVVELQADPSGRFLTVTDAASSHVHVLLIDPNLGTLKEAPGSPFTVANALFTAVGTTGEFLYVTDQSDGQILIFLIDVTSSTKVLTPAPIPSFQEPTHLLANAPISMQVNLTGTFLYTGNTASISFYAINPIDGSLSNVAGSPVSFNPQFNPQLLTMNVTGSFLYALGQGLEGVLGFLMNANGTLTLISGTSTAGGSSVTDMLVSPLGGQMYLLVAGAIDVFTIDPVSGALTAITSTTHFSSSSNLAAAKVQ